MVILSAALRKLLLTCSEEELARIALIWGIHALPDDAYLDSFELVGEQMLSPICARFAWESLSEQTRALLHQVISLEVMDGIPGTDLQKLARLSDVEFAASLKELEQSLMLFHDRPGMHARARMEVRGERVNHVLSIPKDFRGLLAAIDDEIYASDHDRSQMTLIEVLRTCDAEKLQAMADIYNRRSAQLAHFPYGSELARSLAGRLVQVENLEFAWSELDEPAQKFCRWLCRHEGSVDIAEIRLALNLSNAALSAVLHQLENYGLVFDTFSGQERKVFVGPGIYRVLARLIQELDQLLQKQRLEASAPLLLEIPPVVIHEAETLALYDLAIVIGATYQQTIEPTQAGYVPKRVANKLSPLLHTHRPDMYGGGDHYLDILFRAAQQLGLLKLQESVGQKPHFLPGDDLEVWARRSQVEQIRQLLELWWNPANYFWSDIAGVNFRVSDVGLSIEMRNARRVLTQYLIAHCEPGHWYSIKSFLATLKEHDHLLLRPKPRYSPAFQRGVSTLKYSLERWDQEDGEIIIGLLSSTLHEFGLVNLGYDQDHSSREQRNPLAFQLTDLAARVFQAQPNIEDVPVAPEAAARRIIVQPNFEVLLLQPDYNALYRLLAFVHVEQVGMVSRLTLNQESIRRGVESGWSIEQMIQALQELSQESVPQNVLYTLQDWGRLYKDATVSQVLLLEVNNEAVADEICSSAKFRTLELRRLGPLAIAVQGQVSLQVLRTTLEKGGLIVRIQGDIVNVRDAVSTYYGRRR